MLVVGWGFIVLSGLASEKDSLRSLLPPPYNDATAYEVLDQWTEQLGVGEKAVKITKFKLRERASGIGKVIKVDAEGRLLEGKGIDGSKGDGSPGKIHPRLRERFEALRKEGDVRGGRLSVIVWFVLPEAERKAIEAISLGEGNLVGRRKKMAARFRSVTNRGVKELGLSEGQIIYRFQFAPSLAAQLTLKECQELEKSSWVNYLFPDEEGEGGPEGGGPEVEAEKEVDP